MFCIIARGEMVVKAAGEGGKAEDLSGKEKRRLSEGRAAGAFGVKMGPKKGERFNQTGRQHHSPQNGGPFCG